MDIFNFLHENIHQGKVASETSTFGWVYLGVPSRTQTCLELLRVLLGSLGWHEPVKYQMKDFFFLSKQINFFINLRHIISS